MVTENQQPINPESDPDEISLKELILKIQEWYRYLLSKWLIIVIFGFTGGLLGVSYAFFQKPIYTANTTFVLEDDKGGGGLGSLAGLASIAGLDLGGGGGIFQGENILVLYKSRKMIQQTLLAPIYYKGERELLINIYIKSNHLKEKWANDPNLSKLEFRIDSSKSSMQDVRLRDSVLAEIVADISMNYLVVSKVDKKLSVIKAEVKSHDEFFAKTFNDELVMRVNDFYVQTKTKKSLENVLILQQKTDSVRAVMNGAIYQAAAVADATPNLNPTRQVQRIVPVQKSQFSAETNKAILSMLVQNLEMSKIALRREMPLIQVIDGPTFPLAKEQFGKKKGLILGGIVFGFLSVFILIVNKKIKEFNL